MDEDRLDELVDLSNGELEEVVLLGREVEEGRLLVGELTCPPPPPPLMKPRAFKDAETQRRSEQP